MALCESVTKLVSRRKHPNRISIINMSSIVILVGYRHHYRLQLPQSSGYRVLALRPSFTICKNFLSNKKKVSKFFQTLCNKTKRYLAKTKAATLSASKRTNHPARMGRTARMWHTFRPWVLISGVMMKLPTSRAMPITDAGKRRHRHHSNVVKRPMCNCTL